MIWLSVLFFELSILDWFDSGFFVLLFILLRKQNRFHFIVTQNDPTQPKIFGLGQRNQKNKIFTHLYIMCTNVQICTQLV